MFSITQLMENVEDQLKMFSYSQLMENVFQFSTYGKCFPIVEDQQKQFIIF